MITDGTIKRADAMKVRYFQIKIHDAFNLREPDSVSEAGIEALTNYTLAGGPLPPLEVVAMPDGSDVEIVDGHRHHEAYGRTIARGAPLSGLQ